MAISNVAIKAPTLAEMIENQKAMEAENAKLRAMLAEKADMKIEAAVSDYSKGTISIRGINRFPISLFLPQVTAVTEYLNSQEFKSFLSNPDTVDRLRCAAVAHEYATGLGKSWPTGGKKTDAAVIEYMAAYDTGYKAAKNDKSLVPSPRKKSAPKTALAR
jgi:hypothetical protein